MPKVKDDWDKVIGARMRARRETIGMSQERLGDLLGLTFQQIQKYEKGVNGVRCGRLPKIASALGVPTSYFFDDALGGVEVPNMSPRALGVALVLDKLPVKMRAALADAVNAAAEIAGAP